MQCPPGTLPDTLLDARRDGGPQAPTCRPVVRAGTAGRRSTVDVGAWAALVFGADAGPGTAELCRPLAQHPDAFGLSESVTGGESGAVELRISLSVPDQDMARVHASVELEPRASSAKARAEPWSGPARAVSEASVETLVEPLRSLGGEANASEVKVEVRCPIAAP